MKGIRLPGEGGMSRAQVDKLVDRAKQLGAGGLVWMRVVDGGALECQVLKFLSEAEQIGIVDTLGAHPGDLLLVAAGPRRVVDHVLGTLRVELGRPPVHEGGLQFLWVVDFPLFEALDDDGGPIPAHHPFTMPHPDDLELLAHGKGEDLLAVRSLAYDLVLNGWELGSGSVRIHRPRRAAADLHPARHLRRGRAGALRLPARRLPLRRPAARRASRSASTASPRSSRARTTSAR